jgi:ATP-dependent RNA helicase DeaD
VSKKEKSEQKRFDQLGLSKKMLAALEEAGYTEPTQIQAGLIPPAMDGADLLGQARTGTGKTAAFAIPIIEMLGEIEPSRNPAAIILVPTRELAVQVRDEVVKLSHNQKVHCVAVYGGKPIRGQIAKLKRGADIVVGTPGRVLDHLSRGTLILHDLEVVVLDEADRMLDIGFRPDIEKILRRCPKDRQTMLLSATVPPPVERLSKRYMHKPERLDYSPTKVAVETIDQYYFTVDRSRKFDLLVRLLRREDPQQAIVFCRTKRMTERLYNQLKKKRKSVGAMHGDMAQGARDRVMSRFREAKLKILVATDVVGRGIDVSGVSHIINYDIPEFCDDYVHRVGRTGRMGREGVAYTFVTPEEGNELTRIEIRIDSLLKRDEMRDFDPREQSKPDIEQDEPLAAPPPPPPPGRRPKRRHRRAL